jgi:hypothetical protein
MCVCMFSCLHVYVCIYIYRVYVCVCMCVFMFAHVRVCIYIVYICMYVCVCVRVCETCSNKYDFVCTYLKYVLPGT